jgi:hypothetical protein
MDVIAHLVYEAAIHRFLLMSILLPSVILCGVFFGVSSSGLTRMITSLFIALAILGFFNVFLGPSIAASVLYSTGEPGTGKVVGKYATGRQYNNHNVVGYNVLIKTPDNRVVETSFDDDDFNVYPPANAERYPSVGDVFTARYLPSFPKDFVIVSNDDKPWAKAIRCRELGAALHEAKSKYEFETESPSFRARYVDAIQSYIGAKCYSDDEDLQRYYQDINNVTAGLK